jgi:hypothetical protein
MDTFNTVEYAQEVRTAFDDAATSKKEIFEKAVAYFGLDALRQTKDGD